MDGHDVHLIREFGVPTERFTKRWIGVTLQKVLKHDVLFGDFHKGDPEAFLSVVLDPRGVWFDVEKDDDQIGLAYITKVIPLHDANAHFVVWNSRVRGTEPIFKCLIRWTFEHYNLQRITAEIPVYQHGVIRFARRLGFVEEGQRRNAVFYKDKWFSSIMLGILRSEVEEAK